MASEVAEQDLPGIGRRFDVHTDDGDLTVVVHHTGRRDLYLSGRGRRIAVTLDDETARRVGAILAGAYFRPAAIARVEALVGGLLIEWLTVPAGGQADGRTIADLEVRRRTRMTIVAIARDGESTVAPEPDQVLRGGDRVVVVGRPDDLAAAAALLGG